MLLEHAPSAKWSNSDLHDWWTKIYVMKTLVILAKFSQRWIYSLKGWSLPYPYLAWYGEIVLDLTMKPPKVCVNDYHKLTLQIINENNNIQYPHSNQPKPAVSTSISFFKTTDLWPKARWVFEVRKWSWTLRRRDTTHSPWQQLQLVDCSHVTQNKRNSWPGTCGLRGIVSTRYSLHIYIHSM